MMLSIWSTHISMRITRWTTWTPLQGSPTFSTSSLTTRVSFDGLLQNRTPWFVCVDFFFVAFVSPCPPDHSAIVSVPVCGACESCLCLEQRHDSDLVRQMNRRQVYQVKSACVCSVCIHTHAHTHTSPKPSNALTHPDDHRQSCNKNSAGASKRTLLQTV